MEEGCSRLYKWEIWVPVWLPQSKIKADLQQRFTSEATEWVVISVSKSLQKLESTICSANHIYDQNKHGANQRIIEGTKNPHHLLNIDTIAHRIMWTTIWSRSVWEAMTYKIFCWLPNEQLHPQNAATLVGLPYLQYVNKDSKNEVGTKHQESRKEFCKLCWWIKNWTYT